MAKYLHKNYPGRVINILHDRKGIEVGTTYEDYLNGKWIAVSPVHIHYMELYPGSSVKDILARYKKGSPTLAEAKASRVQNLLDYDASEAVSSFIVQLPGGVRASTWFDGPRRAVLKTSIDSAEINGNATVTLELFGQFMPIPTAMAKTMLAQVQCYADCAWNKTSAHRVAIESCSTIEDVYAYNYKTGYPDKIVIPLG